MLKYATRPITAKRDAIHKTASTQHIAMPSEEDWPGPQGMRKKFGEDQTGGSRDILTHRQSDWGGVTTTTTGLTVFLQDNLDKPVPEGETFRILLKQRWYGGSGTSWTICKSFAPQTTQITMPAPHHSRICYNLKVKTKTAGSSIFSDATYFSYSWKYFVMNLLKCL